MNIRKIVLLGSILAAGVALLGASRLAAEIHPSSDVLLPYFEVDLKSAPDAARSTLFAVCNDGEDKVKVKVSVVTNWGIPVLELETALDADAVKTVNLRDWLVYGNLPDGQTLSAETLAHVQAALAGKPSPRDGKYYGTAVAEGLAVGAVVLRVTSPGRPDVLWGDSFVVDPKLSFAEGETLVGIDSTVDPPPECKRHGIRFLSGGTFDAGTELMIWTDMAAAPSSTPEPSRKVRLNADFYDEAGHLFDQRQIDLLPVQRLTISSLHLSQPFGWIDLTTEVDSFVTGHYSAQNDISAALHAYCLPEELPPAGPSIKVEKLTNGVAAHVPTGPVVSEGAGMVWTYVVTNTGSVKLTSVALIDDDPALTVTCPQTTLDPGESMVCEAQGTAAACQHQNTAVATGVAPDGTPVSDHDIGYYYGEQRGAIDLEAYLNDDDADLPPGLVLRAGDALTWRYVITNTGAFKLSGVVVADQHGSPVSCATELAPGQTVTCTATGHAGVGLHSFLATVKGQPACGPEVSHSDPTHYNVPDQPAIVIKKLTNGEDADVPTGPKILVGNPVQWTYRVTNIGSVQLTSVHVTDDKGVAVSCPKTALEVGEVMTCTASGVATAGQYGNVGTASGDPPSGRSPVTATDPSHYYGVQASIQIEKLVNGFQADTSEEAPRLPVGSPVTWTYVVVNTGEVALTNAAVTDDRGVAVTCPKTALAPGESMTCTAAGTAVAGPYCNLGTATATPEGSSLQVQATDPACYFGQTVGGEGCTPGYWKNHPSSWPDTGYSTSQPVSSVFPEAYRYPALGNSTLLQALSFDGGTGLSGAAEILLRAGVASLLNASHPGVSFPRTAARVIADVNDALASNNRDTMLVLAAALDADNNLGCPLH